MKNERNSRAIGWGDISRRNFMLGAGAGLGAAALGGGLSGCATALGRVGMGPYATPKGFPAPKFVNTNGIRMAYYEQGEGRPVVFCHGFPELAYSWRFQLPALAKAGYRAIAPDQRGYGLTDRPEAVEAYDMINLTNDLVGLLDELEIEQAIFCGHDWGGGVVWAMPLLHPLRVAGVIGVNTPYRARSPIAPIQGLRMARGEDNYVVAFQKPGVADEALHRDVRKTFSLFLRKGRMTAEQFAQLPDDSPMKKFELIKMLELEQPDGEVIVSPEAFEFYVKTFERTGFTGGINWYRNIDRNWEQSADVYELIPQPSLMISAEDDVVLPPSATVGMKNFIGDLEKHVIADCGHWTQQEKPEELNRIMIDWLQRRFPKVAGGPQDKWIS